MSQQLPTYTTADGTTWRVAVDLTGASAALVVFRHPDPSTSRKNRYAWLNWQGAEANNTRGNIDRRAVRAVLTQQKLAELFTHSMFIGACSVTGPAIIKA